MPVRRHGARVHVSWQQPAARICCCGGREVAQRCCCTRSSVLVSTCREVNAYALTIDDGPSAASDRVLRALAEAGVDVATHFLVGQNVVAFPEAAQAYAAAGHSTLLHSHWHRSYADMTAKEVGVGVWLLRYGVTKRVGGQGQNVRVLLGLWSNVHYYGHD